MQSRRPSGLTPLAIVLPHPPLPRRSSLLSINSPHTPRSCHSPCLPVYYPANRKSTDSWNSSNGPDEMDFDWKPEQVLLLARTLDALPAHLVTPFNGPVPPSNLLDKIARGVSQAKGPADWPHSVRATRVKLLELARTRAKEEAAAEQRRQAASVIREEVEIDDGSNYSYFHEGEEKPLGPRRPLYRQSSMDFIKPGPAEIKDNANIARLSNRLQRSDRTFTSPAYHPYSRTPRTQQTPRRSSSPPLPSDVPSLINPATPSSSTLNSLSSLSSAAAGAPRVLRRSLSTLSTMSSSSGGMSLADPRLQRVRRSDSFCSGPPAPPPKDYPSTAGVKRAPSYGALAQEVRLERSVALAAGDRVHVHTRKLSGSYPSSDEEEKARTKRAKKIKTKTGPVPSTPSAPSPPCSSAPSSPCTTTAPSSPVVLRAPAPPAKDKATSKIRVKGIATCLDEAMKSPKSPTPKSKSEESKAGKTKNKETTTIGTKRPAPMNLQRNPSMFGAELPHLRGSNNNPPTGLGLASSPTILRSPPMASVYSRQIRSPAPAEQAMSPMLPNLDMNAPQTPQSPTSPKVKTLRRVRRLAPARRISFGSLAAPGDEADAEGENDKKSCLGSAFQLL